MKLKPLVNHVLLEMEYTTAINGIVVPQTAYPNPYIGKVIELGLDEGDNEKIEYPIKVGDRVVVDNTSMHKISVTISDERYIIYPIKDILSIIEETE